MSATAHAYPALSIKGTEVMASPGRFWGRGLMKLDLRPAKGPMRMAGESLLRRLVWSQSEQNGWDEHLHLSLGTVERSFGQASVIGQGMHLCAGLQPCIAARVSFSKSLAQGLFDRPNSHRNVLVARKNRVDGDLRGEILGQDLDERAAF